MDSATAAVDAILAEHAALKSRELADSDALAGGALVREDSEASLAPSGTSTTPSSGRSRVKLFKPLSSSRLSNKTLVRNALRTVCLAGRADASSLEDVLLHLEQYSRAHAAGGGVFAIMLKDKSLTRYAALYAVRDTKLGLLAKLHGTGPAEVTCDMLHMSLKYDSGGRRFVEMSGTKGLPANACAIKLRPGLRAM